VGAEGEELAQGPDGLDVTEGGNANQPVSVEIVAEKDPRVAVVGAEEPGLAVVQEIALVNCLETDGEALLRERREDGLLLALGFRPKYSNKQALIKNYDWYVAHLDQFGQTSGISHRTPWKQGLIGLGKKFF